MMKLINQAYSQIANAPLRYYDEQTAAPRGHTGSEARRSSAASADNPYVHNPYAGSPYSNDPYVITDARMQPGRLARRIGACFRFGTGGVFGVYALWLFFVALRLAGHPVVAVVLIISAFLGGGFAMLRYGQNVRWGRW